MGSLISLTDKRDNAPVCSRELTGCFESYLTQNQIPFKIGRTGSDLYFEVENTSKGKCHKWDLRYSENYNFSHAFLESGQTSNIDHIAQFLEKNESSVGLLTAFDERFVYGRPASIYISLKSVSWDVDNYRRDIWPVIDSLSCVITSTMGNDWIRLAGTRASNEDTESELFIRECDLLLASTLKSGNYT